MKLLAILIMLVALYLLYRIAYPKQAGTAKGAGVSEKKEKPSRSVMGKSRFVLPERSQPLQTTATQTDIEKSEENVSIFAAETGERQPAEIPADELDEVFGEGDNPEIMSIPLESETDDEEEETEELNRSLGYEAVMAEGVDYDQLQTAVKVVMEQPDEVSEETGETLMRLENTDMFEHLVSGDEGKMSWIKTVVERHVQNTMPETEKEISGTDYDYGDFDVAGFLS